MKILTKREVIRSSIPHFIKHYGKIDTWKDIIYKLQQLDPETCSAADVDSIIGNNSWTKITCDECDHSVDMVVCLGVDTEYGGSLAGVCEKCIDGAGKLFKGHQ